MSFKFPFGLLGLIGIPVLILIYIIKSKYTEQTIASTYLWTLSEKFLKKRKPISKITGIITLVLQILAVTAISGLIAQPIFTIKNSANDYCFILDGSASMNMGSNGETRFDRAKKRILEIVEASSKGSTYTLILADDAAEVAFEGVVDKEQVRLSLSEMVAGWCNADIGGATAMAREFFDNNRSGAVYLFSDTEFATENVEYVSVAAGERNFSFGEYSVGFSGSGVIGKGTVVSHLADETIHIEMYAATEIGGNVEKVGETSVSAKAGEAKAFAIETTISSYSYLQLKITNADALSEDNVVVLYDEAKSQARRALIVSDLPDAAYLRSALQSAGRASVDVVTSKDYAKTGGGYGLYVFNGYAPERLPENAAIWLINAVSGPVKGAGVTYRDTQVPRDETGIGSYYLTQFTNGSSSTERALTAGLIGRSIAVRKYSRYGIPRRFTTIMSIGSDAVIAAGLNDNGDREVVFSFAIGDSELGLSDDFIVLVENLTKYSFPSVLEKTAYTCGETISVNVVPGCTAITVVAPSGRNMTLDTSSSDIAELMLTETGTYTFGVKLSAGADMTLYAFSRVSNNESGLGEAGEMKLSGEKEYNFKDGYFDELWVLFLLLGLLVIADWGVYCYEQYQLR